MKELNNLLLYVCLLIIFIFILLLLREHPLIDKTNLLQAFKSI